MRNKDKAKETEAKANKAKDKQFQKFLDEGLKLLSTPEDAEKFRPSKSKII
jgi:hypothetical protein